MRRIFKYAVGAVSLISLTACPSLPSPKASQALGGLDLSSGYLSGRAAVPEMVSSLGQVFKDSGLKRQMQLSQQNNPDLALAAARLEEAGFNSRGARSGFFPSLTGNVNGRRSQINSAGAGFNFGSIINNQFNSSLDAQWEVDLWGRIRAGVVAADADRNALAGEYAAVQQSIAAQTAQAYFNLVAATQLRNLATERLESFQNTVDLLNRRFELGTADLGAVSLAMTDAENARAEIGARKDTRDQAARLLATLTGSYPSASGQAGSWPSIKHTVAAGIPSTLLEKRPDIFAAYSKIVAADANVKVAHRDLFPRFTLTASNGRQTSSFRQLSDANFNVWAIASNLSTPIIDGGSRRAELRASNARAKQALASYRATVLNAFREVEDALGSEQALKDQESAAARAVDAAKKAEDRSLRNFESGLIEILELLETKRRRFLAEEQLINLRNARYQNRVSLALALGKAY